MKKQFIMVIADTVVDNCLFHDMKKDKRIIFKDAPIRKIARPMQIIRKIHNSGKINAIVNLPFRDIWRSTYSLNEINWDSETQYYVIFTGSAVNPISCTYLNKLKQKYNIKYIMYMLDPIQSKPAFLSRKCLARVDFDYIFSFDKIKEDNKNIYPSESHYSMITEPSDEPPEYDLYYTGSNRNRLQNILGVYLAMLKNNGEGFFRINHVDKADMQYRDQIIYNKYIPYPKLISETLKTNCILEILNDGQLGSTLRYYEAVCYNKKLLTTNKNVVDLPFYNPDYMKVFEKPEDIDWDWIKRREKIDYGYDGRFSPVHIIDKILESEKEG